MQRLKLVLYSYNCGSHPSHHPSLMTTRPRHSMEAADRRRRQRQGGCLRKWHPYRKRGGGFLCAPDPDRSAELLWVQHTGPDTERRVYELLLIVINNSCSAETEPTPLSHGSSSDSLILTQSAVKLLLSHTVSTNHLLVVLKKILPFNI